MGRIDYLRLVLVRTGDLVFAPALLMTGDVQNGKVELAEAVMIGGQPVESVSPDLVYDFDEELIRATGMAVQAGLLMEAGRKLVAAHGRQALSDPELDLAMAVYGHPTITH